MNTYQVCRVLLFGDTHGLPQLLKAVPLELVVGLCCAGLRPQYHSELRGLAKNTSLPLLVQPTASSPQYQLFVEDVKRLRPELILVNSYSMLLREDILSIPKYEAINIHGALLPQYRGCNPIQWALLNNEVETGVTMHYMSKEFDTGDIIAQRKVPISFSDTWREVQTKISDATEGMLKEEMPKLLSLTNDRSRQDQSKARYFNRRHPDDGLIDWSKHGVRYIYNLVRALVTPHPGAFYFRDLEKVILGNYLTLQDIVTLKFGHQGKERLATEVVQLVPVGKDNALNTANSLRAIVVGTCATSGFGSFVEDWNTSLFQRSYSVAFGIYLVGSGQMVGACGLNAIDMLSGSADLEVSGQQASDLHSWDYTGVIHLALRVAFAELGLERVSLRIRSAGVEIVRPLRECGFIWGDQTSEDEQCFIVLEKVWREQCH